MTVTKKTAIGRLAAPFTVTDGVVTIDAATTSVAGLMSASDKTKLDGIAAGAEVNVNADWNATEGMGVILNKPTIPSAYTLPTASDTVLGGVKVGSGLAIDGDGVISAEGSVNHASEHITGGDDIIPDAVASTSSGLLSGVDKAKLDGIAAGANNYSLPTAAADTLGGVKIGSGITITDGVISASGGDALPSQDGNNGKFLTTDGTDASWMELPSTTFASADAVVTLPENPSAGQVYQYVGNGVAWTINANTGQTIRSLGDTGNQLTSGHNYASVALICIGTDVWSIYSSYGTVNLGTV